MRTKEQVLTIGLALVLAGAAYAEFTPGHVFVSYPAAKFCGDAASSWDQIWEIDPETGESSLFVELSGEDCGYVSGLAFTPHGSRLRVSLAIKNQIVEFDSEGHMTVLYDSTDGISGPFGFNNLAYDRQQPPYFYVLNAGTGRILRFPPDGSPPTVFADSSDGILGSGSIAFAADGDLFFASSTGAWYLQRITPEGEGFLFEDYGNFICPVALAADHAGNVYIGLTRANGQGDLLRYQAGDPASKELLATGVPFILKWVMTMSPDQSLIYAATPLDALYGVDPANGALTLLAEIPGAPPAPPQGIAVVPPRPSMIPATSTWGLLVLTLTGFVLGTLMIQRRLPCSAT